MITALDFALVGVEPATVPVPVVEAVAEPVVILTVADPDVVAKLERDEVDVVMEIVTDSAVRHVAAYTLIADDCASPEHFSVMFPAISGSREPQIALRSAGLGWRPTAANRQLGGVASPTCATATAAMKTKVKEPNMTDSSRR